MKTATTKKAPVPGKPKKTTKATLPGKPVKKVAPKITTVSTLAGMLPMNKMPLIGNNLDNPPMPDWATPKVTPKAKRKIPKK